MSISCRVCASTALTLVKPSNIEGGLSSSDFAITDSRYGVTGELYQCRQCGFLQCVNLDQVLAYYENLKDPTYEAGRTERAIQARKILQTIQQYRPSGRLLDIGAGSGILVEQALKLGYQAEGIEPSRWLQQRAQATHHLPVHLGTFPHPQLTGPYQVIAMIDVIEHVPAPVELLTAAAEMLAQDGLLVVVTPDVKSVMARLLGWQWWHFRIAHIGYFTHSNLNLAATRAGLQPGPMFRPSWYFTADYLFERVMTYLPRFLRLATPSLLKHITIPLNLFDSMLCLYTLQR